MFRKARIRLTAQYSAVFLICFWAFSLGIKLWMDKFLEVDVGEALMKIPFIKLSGIDLGDVVPDINEAALDQLQFIMVILNLALLVIIPVLCWYLTGKVLEPVRQAHDAQRQFVSDAAHELRTPLTIIQGEIEVALKKARQPDEYRAVLASSRQELRHLAALSERLLFLARQDDGQEPLRREAIDLTDMVSSILASYRGPLAEKAISLRFVPAEDSISIAGDPMMLSRLISNLMDNAIKFTPRDGCITVTLSLAGKEAVIDVSDTGIGIAPEMQDKIFDRFARADDSRGETKGFGLGLSICRTIATRHGGAISVFSTPGKGSTFSLRLPLP